MGVKELCNFSWDHYIFALSLAQKSYEFILFDEFDEKNIAKNWIILRHDIDFQQGLDRALECAKIEQQLGVRATYFIRVHGEYNPFNFKNYMILKKIKTMGHEIGLHYEVLDFSTITQEEPRDILIRGTKILETVLNSRIKGIAAHNDFTGINNLEFWKNHSLSDFGFSYRAYDDKFFQKMRYVSDSLGKWKWYLNGKKRAGKCMCEHIEEGIERLYILTHPKYWYQVSYHLF